MTSTFLPILRAIFVLVMRVALLAATNIYHWSFFVISKPIINFPQSNAAGWCLQKWLSVISKMTFAPLEKNDDDPKQELKPVACENVMNYVKLKKK